MGGDAWVRFGLAHFLQRLIVFWWFLQTYMTSGPCSSWFFLVTKSWFFWCYLGLQVMAILCRAAKNSLRGTLWEIYIFPIGLSFLLQKNIWIDPQNQCSGSGSISLYGSGSGSISLYGSGSFSHPAKRIGKTLIPTVLWLLLDFLSLKNYVRVPSVPRAQKKKTNALQVPLPRRLSWPCVSDLQLI